MLKKSGDARLSVICDECGKPVEGKEGWITVDLDDALSRMAAEREWERENGGRAVDLSELDPLPARADWRAYHESCDPDPETWAYWFWAERCDTLGKLLHWAGHLMQKRWLRHTNWSDLLQRLGVEA